MRSTSPANAWSSQALLPIARDAATAVADAAATAIGAGRWIPTPHALQSLHLARSILALDAEIGPGRDPAACEGHVQAMAESAHLIMRHARIDQDKGWADLSRVLDWQLLDGCMEDALVPAYAIVAVAA